MHEGFEIQFKKLRHPVIEKQLPPDNPYIPNDLLLDKSLEQVIILTGPNMSGKSAILRQTALAIIMAQAGCFVPAESAELGVTDKIFSRVGASDNLSAGESTFMVEMIETASILNNLSERSLVLMDEIGRGTSTYDGVSLAWSIAEALHNNIFCPKTIFATHYHELNELEKTNVRIHNYHVSVKETQGQVIFLRKLSKGGIESSFGLHVAKMAGIPAAVISRAEEILATLESSRSLQKNKDRLVKAAKNYQISMFEADNPEFIKIKEILRSTDINSLSPIDALLRIKELKEIVG
jgi:DNA mismatch repair protein MutS